MSTRNFDPSSYETVKQRKQRFYKDFPDARIYVSIENDDIEEKALFKASVYTCREDQKDELARGVGYALEIRDKEKQINKYGKEYESVNFSSWTENAEESAVGRALDNAGYASNNKPSREEIEKVGRMSQVLTTTKQTTTNTQEYTIPFGQYKGMSLDKLTKEELISYGSYLSQQEKLNPQGRELVDKIRSYLKDLKQ